LKRIVLFIALISSSIWAGDQTDNSTNYDKAGLPNFLPHVGHALPGRCFSTHTNKKIASVLMVSFEEEGFDLAPFDQDKGPEDLFDQMSYEDVLKNFPLIKKLFVTLNETADGGILYRSKGAIEYRYEIRESDKYFIFRCYSNDKLDKICHYKK
jgi:hypothetical protein